MWPVVDSGGGLKATAKMYMSEILDIEAHVINRIAIETASATQSLPRSKVKDEILVHFHTIEDRDLVYSHARNLAKHTGKAGIRLEIPQHLRPDFKLLESHGNTIRTMYGPAVKRSIRFDDSECSLVLNMRLTPDDPWVAVSVDQAREAKKMRSQAAVSMIRSSFGARAQTMTASQGRALGLPQATPTTGKRPRPLTSPATAAAAAANATAGGISFDQNNPNPFSYLNIADQ